MRILRLLAVSFAVFALVGSGFYGCGKKQVKTDEGALGTQAPSGEAGKGAEDGSRAVTEAPPGPKETPEPVEPARAEDALKDALFEFDRFDVTASTASVLQEDAKWIKANPDAVVTIEGHCDERGTVEYNLALGERRSKAARDYLVSLGIDASRLKTISYGKSKPADPASNEAAWAKNRRAHFVVQ